MNFLLPKLKISSEEENEDSPDNLGVPAFTESLPTASKMDIFLRIRSIDSTDRNNSANNAYEVQDSSTLIVKNNYINDNARRSNIVRLSENTYRKKFKFTRIFDTEIDQRRFFHEAIKPTVIDFLNSQSSTVISYGTADAGKTQTFFGTAFDPGIIPRSIEFIYSSVNCTLVPSFKPKDHKTVIALDECDRALEIDTRMKLLSCRCIDRAECQEAYEALERAEHNESSPKDSMYSAWISFVEIYNDTVFDLLEVDEDGRNMQLKLTNDKDGATYIQGMRSVCATTGLEAYKILNAGQTRLSTDSSSNYKSSRSHSIFIIKLLKHEKEADPAEVEVSCLSFCDLAGAGKIQKAIDNEKQFRESRSINTSLLAFGRYIKVLAEKHSRQSIGPFRDSKLTRLFQHSLRRENIILLINVNPSPELWAETQNVLNFASTAMKLTSDFAREDKRFLDYYTPISSPKVLETHSSESARAQRDEEINDLLRRNKQLTTELEEAKANQIRREFIIRQELTDSFTQQLNGLEEDWKNRILAMEQEKDGFLQFSVDRLKDSYRCQFEEYVRRKRKRTGKHDDMVDVGTAELENSRSKTMTASLEYTIEQMKEENRLLLNEKNRYATELSLLKRQLMEISTSEDCVVTNLKELPESKDSELENKNACFTSDASFYLRKIQNLLEKSSRDVVNRSVNTKKIFKPMHTKKVQCPIIGEFLVDIKKLLCPSLVELPELEDSMEEFTELPDKDLNALQSEIRDLILQKTSRLTKLEAEMNEKSSHLELLRRRIEEDEKEILETRLLYEESESARLSLNQKVENLEKSLKSKESFKNPAWMVVESENSWLNESNQLIFIEPHSSSEQQSVDDSNSSSFDLDSERLTSKAARSSSDSSKNDSGLASSLEPATSRSFDEKSSQTNSLDDEKKSSSIPERLMQLKLDYKQMKAQHIQEALKVIELSQELKGIKETMEILKESTCAKERIIVEYQNKCSVHKLEIERLCEEKKKWESKCDDLTKEFREANLEYEKKLIESQVKLKFYEDDENQATRCLEDYWKKSIDLGSELSIAYTELEKNSKKCYKDHVVRLDKLEKELSEKRMKETELEVKIDQYKSDLSDMDRIVEKVYEFENSLHKVQQEKIDLQKSLNARSRNQLEIREMLQALTKRLEERDNKILSLRSEIDALTEVNLSNSRNAKELGREVGKLLRKICNMKSSIADSEEARKNLERDSNKEINNLRARLSTFEENAELFNLISNANDDKQYEAVEKLKVKLLEKEKELKFFKKNRNATIQRYECLARQLQDALKINHTPSKVKKSSPYKNKRIGGDLRESASCGIYNAIEKSDWNPLCDTPNYIIPFSSMRTLINSPIGSLRITSCRGSQCANDTESMVDRGLFSNMYPDTLEDLENQVETDS